MSSVPSTPQPIELKRVLNQGLFTRWSDDVSFEIPSETLRSHCPCATCLQQRGDTSHAKPLMSSKSSLLKVIEHTKGEQIQLISIWTVGNYALGIEWGDGHKTGIYTWGLLRSLKPA